MTKRPQTRQRPTREQKRQANRERILAAARRVFGARGYQAATIEEIADEAGLSNGAIYYNFASKEELFVALLDARSQERLEHAREALAGERDPRRARGALEREALDITHTFKESREWRLLLLEFVGYAARNPRFGQRLRKHEDELNEALVALLEQVIETLSVEPAMSTDRLALTIGAILDGLAIRELTEPGTVPDELFGEAVALLLTGRSQA
jgi:AcrR family transcriptional regulator